MSINKSYINNFKDKFEEFINFCLIDDIFNKIEDKNMKINIQKYSKFLGGIDYIKLASVLYTNTTSLKEDILRHKPDLFVQSKVLLPQIDFSILYDIVKDTLYINQFWDVLAELKILSNVIIEPLLKEKDEREKQKKKYTKKEQKDIIDSINTMTEEEINAKIDNFSISKSNAKDVSLSSIIDANDVEEDYKNSALLEFFNSIDSKSSSFEDILLNAVKKMDLKGELDKIDDDKLGEITKTVNKLLGTNTDDGMGNIVKDITQSLKQTDITQGSLGDNLQNIASNITDKLMKSNNEDSLKSIANKAKDIMKDYNANDDMMTNVENIMKSKFGKSFSQMGTNKAQVEKMLASYGLMNNGVNNRKIQRMAKKQAGNPSKGHTQASVNARQQALKAKYEKRKLEKEKREKEKENKPQQNNKQNQQNKQTQTKQQPKKK